MPEWKWLLYATKSIDQDTDKAQGHGAIPNRQAGTEKARSLDLGVDGLG